MFLHIALKMRQSKCCFGMRARSPAMLLDICIVMKSGVPVRPGVWIEYRIVLSVWQVIERAPAKPRIAGHLSHWMQQMDFYATNLQDNSLPHSREERLKREENNRTTSTINRLIQVNFLSSWKGTQNQKCNETRSDCVVLMRLCKVDRRRRRREEKTLLSNRGTHSQHNTICNALALQLLNRRFETTTKIVI